MGVVSEVSEINPNIIEIIEFTSILNRLNLERNVWTKVVDFISNNFDFICSASTEAYEGEVPDFKICENDSFTMLAIVCFKLIELRKDYRIKEIPDSVFFDTIQGIKLRQEIYYKENQK